MSSDRPTLQAVLQYLDSVCDKWFYIGIALKVKLNKLRGIETSYPKEGVKRWMVEMIQYWLDTTPAACWKQVVSALEQVDQLTLASTIKQEYLWKDVSTLPATNKNLIINDPSTSSPLALPSPSLSVAPIKRPRSTTPPPFSFTPDAKKPKVDPATTPPSLSSTSDDTESTSIVTAPAEIQADVKIVEQLRDLECELSLMLTNVREKLANCNIERAKFFLNNLFGTADFDECRNISDLINQLCNGKVDTFNVYPLEKLAICLKRPDVTSLVKRYKDKKKRFFKKTKVVDFLKTVVNKAKPLLPKGKVEITIKVHKEFACDRVLKDIETLAKKAFGDNQKWFVSFHAIPGSIIIMWHVPETLCDTLEQLVYEKAAMLREEGVKEVTLNEKIVLCSIKEEKDLQEAVPPGKPEPILQKVYQEFHHQLVDVLSDHDTHHFIVSKLHTRAVISQEVMVAQMNSNAGSDRGSFLLTVLGLDNKPHKLRELIAAMMEEENVRSLAEEMAALISKSEQELPATKELVKYETTTVVQEQATVIAQLNTKLKSVEENLEDANKLLVMRERLISSLLSEEHRMQTELREKKRRIGDLEMTLGSFLPFLVQVNGEGRETATAGQETSIELSVFSQANSLLPSNQLSCQLTDPNSQHVQCNITSIQPRMATVSYTPILCGAHQLKITVGDTDIPGSPFTVHVLPPSLEIRKKPINIITGIDGPLNVAVSERGEVVVSEYFSDCISVFGRDGRIMTKFGCEGSRKPHTNGPRGVGVTVNNHIIVADRYNHRIQMFTMEGKFVRSVGEEGSGPLQFYLPSGISVHPSGLVFVADTYNHRIQVLGPDLSLVHTWGSIGSEIGQLKTPRDVACDSRGRVYVADLGNHRVQIFSNDGQFISSFNSKDGQQDQLFYPTGICIDSTDTVYVTDYNNSVSAFDSDGKFLRCLESEKKNPRGIAVDNTTGNIYVCDRGNNRIVVY